MAELLPLIGIAQAGLVVGGVEGVFEHSKLQFILGLYERNG